MPPYVLAVLRVSWVEGRLRGVCSLCRKERRHRSATVPLTSGRLGADRLGSGWGPRLPTLDDRCAPGQRKPGAPGSPGGFTVHDVAWCPVAGEATCGWSCPA